MDTHTHVRESYFNLFFQIQQFNPFDKTIMINYTLVTPTKTVFICCKWISMIKINNDNMYFRFFNKKCYVNTELLIYKP